MWIAVRLIAALVAFVARYVRRFSPPRAAGDIDGTPYFQDVHKYKGQIRGFRIGVGHRMPVIFRLQPEGSGDRFFKAVGLSNEFQTGDAEFDRHVYIACDHVALFHHLRANNEARARIREVLAAGFRRISGDGEVIWIESTAKRQPTMEEVELALRLRDAIAAIGKRFHYYSDPFLGRALAVEALTWSILGYGAAGVGEYLSRPESTYLHARQLLWPSLAAAALMFGVVFGAIVLFLRGSSRGHRLLIEGAILLALGLPMTGAQVVSDLNRAMDVSGETKVSSRITWTERIRHRSRRGGVHYTYHLHLWSPPNPFGMPDRISVGRSMFAAASEGQFVDVYVGKGWLGIPWFRRFALR
ncbi:MAG: hypothetical protein EXR93_08810 [Gemmatimonadetes bacterium]|nr:hypothetical protein [Gemmatimonadota bacterium]